MDKRNKFDLISNIISLIYSEDCYATIPAIADYCNIPIEYARKCILQLIKNNIFTACIRGEHPDLIDTDYFFMEEYLGNKEQVSRDILQGKYDNLEWYFDIRILPAKEDQVLGLSALEYGAIQALGESYSTLKSGAIYERKDTIAKISNTIRNRQQQIQTAIDNKIAISFSYRNREGTINQYSGYPLSIATNVVDNWIYFYLANDDNTYRLDRVISTIKTIKDFGPYPKIDDNPNRKYIWGPNFSKTDQPIHVKLRISDTTTNIIRKIQNDIRHREGLCTFYENDGFYYYEDDIIGMAEFRRWIRGYGSSIQVIEPVNVREEIINAAKKTLSNYERVDEWKDL